MNRNPIYFCPSTNWPLEAPAPVRRVMTGLGLTVASPSIQSITFISLSPGDLSSRRPMTGLEEAARN